MKRAGRLMRKVKMLAALFRDGHLPSLVLVVLASKRLPRSLIRIRAGVITHSQSIPVFPRSTDAVFRRLRLDDLACLARIPPRPGYSTDAVRTRFVNDLQQGRDGFVALIDDEVVAYSWVTYGEHSIPGMRFNLLLHPSEAFTGNSYVVPKYRYTRVYAGLVTYVSQYLKDRGIRSFFGYTYVTNRHSIRTHNRMGYEIVGWILLAELPIVDLQLTRLRWDGDRVQWRLFRRTKPHVTAARPIESRRARHLTHDGGTRP